MPSVKYWNPGTQAYVGISSTLNPIANDYGYMAFIRGDRTITTTSQSPVFYRHPHKRFRQKQANIHLRRSVWSGPVGFDRQPLHQPSTLIMLRTGGVPNTFYVWDPLLTSGSGSRYGFGWIRTITWDSGSGSYIVTPSGGSLYQQYGYRIRLCLLCMSLSAGTVSFLESSKTNGGNLVSRPVEPSGKQLKVNLYVYSNWRPL